jgi:predicted kinase
MSARLVLVRGLPGSGKSTLAKALASPVGVHLEADQFMVNEAGTYHFDPSRLRMVHKACFEATAEALRQGKSVYVSNTFTELWEMAPYRHLALNTHTPLQIIECKADFGSIHNVPSASIAAMAARWAVVPPEGLPAIAPQDLL